MPPVEPSRNITLRPAWTGFHKSSERPIRLRLSGAAPGEGTIDVQSHPINIAWGMIAHRAFRILAGDEMRLRLLACTVSAIWLTSACAPFTAAPARADLLGSPAPASAAAKTIVISPTTRWVNVTGGEIIRFVVDSNRHFAWNFDVPTTISSFSLNQIAPPGVLDHPVVAYVAPNPLYLGDRGRESGGDR